MKATKFKPVLQTEVKQEMVGRCWVYTIKTERRTINRERTETFHFCPDHLKISLYKGSEITVERS